MPGDVRPGRRSPGRCPDTAGFEYAPGLHRVVSPPSHLNQASKSERSSSSSPPRISGGEVIRHALPGALQVEPEHLLGVGAELGDDLGERIDVGRGARGPERLRTRAPGRRRRRSRLPAGVAAAVTVTGFHPSTAPSADCTTRLWDPAGRLSGTVTLIVPVGRDLRPVAEQRRDGVSECRHPLPGVDLADVDRRLLALRDLRVRFDRSPPRPTRSPRSLLARHPGAGC